MKVVRALAVLLGDRGRARWKRRMARRPSPTGWPRGRRGATRSGSSSRTRARRRRRWPPRRGRSPRAPWRGARCAAAPRPSPWTTRRCAPAYVAAVAAARHPRAPAVALAERDERGGHRGPGRAPSRPCLSSRASSSSARFRRRREEIERARRGRRRRRPEPLRKASDPRLRHVLRASSTRSACPPLHDVGLHGEGVVVAVFDAGFDNLPHEAFAAMRIVATRDFVNGDDDVANGGDRGEGSHGTATLSVLGGFRPASSSAPPSPRASSWPRRRTRRARRRSRRTTGRPRRSGRRRSARTSSAARSATSTTTAPFPSYTAADMNGDTAISTRAADLAGERGRRGGELRGQRRADHQRTTRWARPRTATSCSPSARSPRPARARRSAPWAPRADGRIKPDVAAQGVARQGRAPRHRHRLHDRQRDVVLVPAHGGGGRAAASRRNPRPRSTEVFGALRAHGQPGRAARTTCWARASSTPWPPCGWSLPLRLP